MHKYYRTYMRLQSQIIVHISSEIKTTATFFSFISCLSFDSTISTKISRFKSPLMNTVEILVCCQWRKEERGVVTELSG